MRLRTVAKLGMVLSVVLFCTAVGFYGFAKLSLTDKSREINLFQKMRDKQYTQQD